VIKVEKHLDRKLFGKRLSELLAESGDTNNDLARICHLSASAISRYSTGTMSPKIPTIRAIAEHYGVSPLWLQGIEGVSKYLTSTDRKGAQREVPLLGKIAAGKPIIAEEDIEEYVFADAGIDFCLRVQGDSMKDACIPDGSIVYVHKQPEVENGQVAVVLVDGEDATVKRFYRHKDFIQLKPANADYDDIILTPKQAKDTKILGRVMYCRLEVK